MQAYAPELNTAMEQWSRVYDVGACDVQAVSAVVADGAAYAALCGDTPSKGCHSIAPRPDRHVLVINAQWANEARNTITHEAMHWLSQCSGTYRDDQPAHDDPLIWRRGGILDRTDQALDLPHD